MTLPQYACAKCGHTAYKAKTVNAEGATSGWLLGGMGLHAFRVVFCARCGYADLYVVDELEVERDPPSER